MNVSSKDINVTLTLNFHQVNIRYINIFLKKLQRVLKEKGIEKLIIEAIEINFDFEAKTELHHVCQDLSRFSGLFSKVTENSKAFINFHSYQPITLFEDLGIEGKNLTSSITLNLQYREHKKGKGIPLYDLKIYCKGIERSLRRRAAVKDEVLWKKNVIRFEMKLKRQYLCGKNRGKVFYEQIYNEDEDCCSINTTALYHKISFRFSSRFKNAYSKHFARRNGKWL